MRARRWQPRRRVPDPRPRRCRRRRLPSPVSPRRRRRARAPPPWPPRKCGPFTRSALQRMRRFSRRLSKHPRRRTPPVSTVSFRPHRTPIPSAMRLNPMTLSATSTPQSVRGLAKTRERFYRSGEKDHGHCYLATASRHRGILPWDRRDGVRTVAAL